MLTNQYVVDTEIQALKNEEGTSNGRGSQTHNTQYGRMFKIEFLKFHGVDVKGWVYRCKQFFKIDGIEEERRVELASMHLYDQALVWHQQYVKNFVQQYQEAYESLLNRVKLNEAYIVSLLIEELKKEFVMPIRMFKITNLIDVYVMAKMQKATNTVLKPRYNSSLLPTSNFVFNSVNKPLIASFKSTNVNGVNQNVSMTGGNRLYRLTQKELEEKRAKNKCFYCDQKYFPGHKCSEQLYSLEETMRVKGMFGKHTLHILVDCGGTHNFLDLKTTKNLGCKFESTIPLQVYVANVQNMLSCYECKNFQWSLQRETFTSDVMLLPLGGYEMVLGIQWLASLGDIQCNFKNLTMKFEYNARRMVLRGTKNSTVHWMQGRNASKSDQIRQDGIVCLSSEFMENG
nr:hypothetical protein [Tanacetum cinerariifolium]GEW82282.1 hypothetical protein [Tanacetum cinerariifolium]